MCQLSRAYLVKTGFVQTNQIIELIVVGNDTIFSNNPINNLHIRYDFNNRMLSTLLQYFLMCLHK